MKITKWEPGITPEAGKIYSGIPNAIYHGFVDWYGSTMIKHALRSAESFFYEIDQPPKYSMPFERGNALHSGIEGLTKDGTFSLFESEIIECPTKTIDSKAWEDLKAENPEKVILPAMEIEKARIMVQKLFDKASKAHYFTQGWSELSFFWIDKETGLKLKCRPDWLRIDAAKWVLDYKTSRIHYIEKFRKEIDDKKYHLSAAMYLTGVYAVTSIEVENWHFLVIANTPPYEVEAYALDSASLAEGHALFRKALNNISNYEPETKLKPQSIGLYPYAFKLT